MNWRFQDSSFRGAGVAHPSRVSERSMAVIVFLMLSVWHNGKRPQVIYLTKRSIPDFRLGTLCACLHVGAQECSTDV